MYVYSNTVGNSYLLTGIVNDGRKLKWRKLNWIFKQYFILKLCFMNWLSDSCGLVTNILCVGWFCYNSIELVKIIYGGISVNALYFDFQSCNSRPYFLFFIYDQVQLSHILKLWHLKRKYISSQENFLRSKLSLLSVILVLQPLFTGPSLVATTSGRG